VVVVALCIPVVAVIAAPAATLPAGSVLTFVTDDALDLKTARAGNHIRAHLRSDLVVGGSIVAPSGTPAGVLITDIRHDAGAVRIRFALDHFALRSAGELPVEPLTPVVDAIPAGVAVPARTAGIVVVDGDRTIVRVPVPFPLSSDAPSAAFRSLPYRTLPPATAPSGDRPSSAPS
jgi:hypothetical protein